MKFSLLIATTAAIKISSSTEKGGPTCAEIEDMVYKHCDGDDNDKISWKEARKCGAPKEAKKWFDHIAGKDGQVDRAEFNAVCLKHNGGRAQEEAEKGPTCAEIEDMVYTHCDGDDNDKISWKEARKCGAPKDAKPWFDHVAGKDGQVDRAEFNAVCLKHNGGRAQEEKGSKGEKGPTCAEIEDMVYTHCDGDDNDMISWKEARKCGAPKDAKPWFDHVAGKDGQVDRAEFNAVCLKHNGGRAQEDVEEEGPSCKRIAKAVWKHCDADKDGKITWGEASGCGAPASFKPAFDHVAGTDGAVDHKEFMGACKAHGGKAQEEVEVEGPPCAKMAHHIWKHCDSNDDDTISWKEAKGCGAPEEFHDEFNKAAGKDGELSEKEFMAACKAHK